MPIGAVFIVYLESESRNLAAFTNHDDAVDYVNERVARIAEAYDDKQAKVEYEDLNIESIPLNP